MIRRLRFLIAAFMIGAGVPLAGMAQSLDAVLTTLRASPKDQTALARLAELAKSDPRAQVSMSVRLASSPDTKEQDLAVAFAKSAGEAGLAEGWMLYAAYLGQGLGSNEASRSKSRTAIEYAAGLGYPPALIALSELSNESGKNAYKRYKFDFQNTTNPKTLLRKQAALNYAAMKGHAPAVRTAGMKLLHAAKTPAEEGYAFGILTSVPEGPAQRVKALYQSAAAGDANSMRLIAHEFLRWEVRDVYLPESEDQAIRWLVRASDAGDAEALSDLGWLFSSEGISLGKGRRVDQALSFLSLAVERGSKTAPERLARLETAINVRAKREEAKVQALALLAAAIVVIGKAQEFNAPYMPENTWQYDHCAGTSGLGWYSDTLGNAAATFACSKY